HLFSHGLKYFALGHTARADIAINDGVIRRTWIAGVHDFGVDKKRGATRRNDTNFLESFYVEWAYSGFVYVLVNNQLRVGSSCLQGSRPGNCDPPRVLCVAATAPEMVVLPVTGTGNGLTIRTANPSGGPCCCAAAGRESVTMAAPTRTTAAARAINLFR